MAVKRSVTVTIGALLAIALLGVLDWRTGPLFSITIFYVIPVGFVAWYAGRNVAMILSFLCIVIWLIADFNTLGTRVPVGIDLWNGFASLVLLLLISYTLATTKRSLDLEAATVKVVQDSLLPTVVPSIPGLDIGARYRPAGNLSGDYYDMIPFGGQRLAVCVADVSGKGAGPAMLMANLQGSVRALVAGDLDLEVICGRLNSLVAQGPTGFYVTFAMVAVDPAAGTLRYVNAGHNPPLVFKHGEREQPLAATGFPLGVFPDAVYESHVVPVQPGDRIILYTDGITEARNAAGEEFGPDRLVRLVRASADGSADLLAARVMEGLRSFESGLPLDDITLVVVRLPEP